MNGPEHYREAEHCLMRSGEYEPQIADLYVKQAQVHATLALAAAQTIVGDDDVMRCPHGMVICGLCGYGIPAGDGGRA